jgi:hypothetical protein
MRASELRSRLNDVKAIYFVPMPMLTGLVSLAIPPTLALVHY